VGGVGACTLGVHFLAVMWVPAPPPPPTLFLPAYVWPWVRCECGAWLFFLFVFRLSRFRELHLRFSRLQVSQDAGLGVCFYY